MLTLMWMRFQLGSITASVVISQTKSNELNKDSEPQLVDATADLLAKHMEDCNEEFAGGFSSQSIRKMKNFFIINNFAFICSSNPHDYLYFHTERNRFWGMTLLGFRKDWAQTCLRLKHRYTLSLIKELCFVVLSIAKISSTEMTLLLA